jgi:ligand-binding sensor domain-containing protein
MEGEMKKASGFLGFLLIVAIIFSGCGSPKQIETQTSNTTTITTQNTSITSTYTTPTVIKTKSTTSTTSTYTTPTVIITTTTTATPEITIDISNVALISTVRGFNIINEQGLSNLKGFYSDVGALDGVFDDSGKLWYVSSGGIITYDGKNWKSMSLPKGVNILEAITIDQSGRVWVGHYEGVSVLEGEQWRTYSSDTFGLGQYANLVKDIAVDNQNHIWVATSAGVAFLTGETWTPYDESKGLSDNSTEAVLTDHEGNVWVAHSYGVDVFDGNNWVFYGKAYNKPAQIEMEQLNGATTLAVDGQGIVWVGTSYKGISYFDGSIWQTYDCREYFYGAQVNAITCDKQGRVWLGTNFGMTIFDGSAWSSYTQNSSELLSNSVNVILVTGKGPISLTTAPGLQSGSISGQIKSGDQPLAGAKVVVCWDTEMFYSGDSPCLGDSYSAMTDANGEFHIEGIPPYRYKLAVQKPDGKWKILLGYVYIVDGESTLLKAISL